MADRSRHLSRIEFWRESIESPGVNGFELGGVDAPLIRRYLQPSKDRREGIVDMTMFITADDATCPVDQRQVFTKIEQDPILKFVRQPVIKVQ